MLSQNKTNQISAPERKTPQNVSKSDQSPDREDKTTDKMAPGTGQKVQKVMTQPINLIFRFLQNKSKVQVWLYENVNLRIEGVITGFDEYMNLVLDDAEEVSVTPFTRFLLPRENSPKVQ